MSGMDDNVAVIGDWIPPSPSPRTFFSAILGEEVGSRSIQESLGPSEIQGRFLGSKEKLMLGYPDKKDGAQLEASSNQHLTELGSFSDLKSNSRGGLVERMAARAGFNAPKLNTEGIRPNDVLNPDSRSTLLMISPGLSPTTLLESPVFLSNSLAQPSPTTGKFPFFPPNVSNRSSRLISDTPEVATSKENLFKDNDSSSFAFKPIAESGPSFFGSGGEVNQPMFPQQSFPRVDVSAQSENSISLQPHNAEPTKVQSQRMFEAVPGGAEYASPPLDESQDEEGEQKGNGDSTIGGSEDGFNWRKYGQKQVKGSEYPRSYYKCTHPNCPVKKKVERSHEGHITEIIYKGLHNHPKPPPNRRASIGGPDNPEQGGPHGGVDPEPSWTNVPRGSGSEWKQDNIEVTSSPSEGQDFCNQGATGLQAQNGTGALEHGEAVDVSSTFSNEELEDDQGTNGSVSLAYDAEGDESESKRRKIEAYPTDMSGATRAIREPRVVVQTTSEVDILDDGYRWRKYGQKVVKGNPNPRSYYKCTSAGCTVRKHVERASHDLKSVITTYEGKHNHDVPAARNSSHGNAGTSGSGSLAGKPVQAHAHRPEPSLAHNVMPRFDGPGSLSHFGLSGRPLQLGHSVSFGMAAPNLANLGLAGLGPSHGKLPVHPFLAQQRQMNDMSFMLPKGEAKVEPMSEPGLNLSNNSSAVYQQLMSRLPLGPQM